RTAPFYRATSRATSRATRRCSVGVANGFRGLLKKPRSNRSLAVERQVAARQVAANVGANFRAARQQAVFEFFNKLLEFFGCDVGQRRALPKMGGQRMALPHDTGSFASYWLLGPVKFVYFSQT